MHVLAHVLFGALFAVCLVAFGVELPRRRRGLGSSEMSAWLILILVVLLAGTAAFPQSTRFFGDRKLDTGPALNLFLFHDVLDLAGQRFRLGNGLLDPPVTVFALALGISILFLVYLRSGQSPGWNVLWRDVAYLAVILICLIAVRSVVSGKSYLFLPKTHVWVGGDPYTIVEDTVFAYNGVPVVGLVRDRAMTVKEAYLAVNSTSWSPDVTPAVRIFTGQAADFRGLDYETLLDLIAILRQTPGAASPEDLERVIAASTLPRRDLPLTLALGIPLIVYAVAGYLLYPYLENE